jgi:hypothetical protein
MENIFKRLGVPETIYCDEGSEFTNKKFLQMLDSKNIKIIYATNHAPFFWIRLAWPVRWTNTRVLRNIFNLHPPISGGPVGGRSRFLARCHRFHPGIRARDTCHKTRAEVYKAFRFP